jgi:hypothetical protein
LGACLHFSISQSHLQKQPPGCAVLAKARYGLLRHHTEYLPSLAQKNHHSLNKLTNQFYYELILYFFCKKFKKSIS